MRKGGIIITGLVLFGLWASYRTWNMKESIRYFQYNIGGLKFNFSNILNPVVSFIIQVHNPNKTSVPINACFGIIKYKDIEIATFQTTEQINISGQETVSVPIQARVKALAVITSLLRKASVTNLQVDGMIKTSLFDFPISKSIPIKI